MKRKYKYILSVVIAIMFVPLVKGQVATSLYFMDNVPQSSILNPAFDPNYNFYLGLPLVNQTSLNFSSDIGLDNLYSDGTWSWNSSDAFENFQNGLDETSYISTDLNTSIFSLGFRVSEVGYFHFAINHRMNFKFGLPRDLFRMNNLDIDHDLSTLELNMQWYSEYAFAYSHQVNERLLVGVKLKYLAGVAAAEMSFDQFDINTSRDYWEYKLKGELNISAPTDITETDNGVPDDFDWNIDTNDPNELLQFAMFNYSNPGIGIDLGAEYLVKENIKVSASLVDIGTIKWKDNVSNYSAVADYMFEGMIDPLLSHTDGDIVSFNDDAADAIIDSLQGATEATKTNNSFSTGLSPKLYLGAEYEFTSSISAGILSKTHFIKNDMRQNFSLHLNANLERILTFGLNYNIGVGTSNSFGGLVGVKLAPIYLYATADFIPGFSSSGDIPITLPSDFRAANFQFGINFMLGRNKSSTRSTGIQSNGSTLYGASPLSYPL